MPVWTGLSWGLSFLFCNVGQNSCQPPEGIALRAWHRVLVASVAAAIVLVPVISGPLRQRVSILRMRAERLLTLGLSLPPHTLRWSGVCWVMRGILHGLPSPDCPGEVEGQCWPKPVSIWGPGGPLGLCQVPAGLWGRGLFSPQCWLCPVLACPAGAPGAAPAPCMLLLTPAPPAPALPTLLWCWALLLSG